MLMVHWLSMIDCQHMLHLHPKIFEVFFAITAALFLSRLFVLMNDLGAKCCLQYNQYKFSIFKGICFWNLRGVQQASLLVVYDKK